MRNFILIQQHSIFYIRRRDPRSSGPTGPRDPRAGMSRPGPGVPPIPASQPNVPPPVLPSGGGGLNVPVAAAPTAGAIGRALGPGTSDQEKVRLRQKSS